MSLPQASTPPEDRQRARVADGVPTTRDQLGRSFQHPSDRNRERPRGPFERFAERASFFASSAVFFGLCAAAVLVWLAGMLLGAGGEFETTVVGLMSAMTLLLLALLKNSELRSERAIQQKLDAIATSLLEDKRGEGRDAERQLESAIRVHEEL